MFMKNVAQRYKKVLFFYIFVTEKKILLSIC